MIDSSGKSTNAEFINEPGKTEINLMKSVRKVEVILFKKNLETPKTAGMVDKKNKDVKKTDCF